MKRAIGPPFVVVAEVEAATVGDVAPPAPAAAATCGVREGSDAAAYILGDWLDLNTLLVRLRRLVRRADTEEEGPALPPPQDASRGPW